MRPRDLAWDYAVTLVTHIAEITHKKQGMSCLQRGWIVYRMKQQTHQAGFTDDADEDAAG